jgi:hypothetical protein
MAIWDRNDNGNRGNMGGRARNLADRAGNAMRQGMDQMHDRGNGGYDRMNYQGRPNGGWNGDSSGGHGMRPTGNGYDRDMTYRGVPGGNVNGGLGRSLGYGYGAGDRDEAGFASMHYDREYGMGGGRMNTGYDRGFGAAGGTGYDRGFQGGRDTDNGDPFGDRQQQTPIRVMRGREGNMGGGNMGRGDFGDRGMGGRDRGGYDRNWAFGAQGMERTDFNRGDRNNRLSSDRLDREDESYRAYQDYSGYNRGQNYDPYYNSGELGAQGGGDVGDPGFAARYDANFRNRRDRDWF